MSRWRSVPDDKSDAWSKCVSEQIMSPGRLECCCPVCGTGKLQFFFARGTRGSHGSAWFWCPVCRSAEHSQSRVPMWWTWTGDIDRILTADLNTGEPFDLLSELWEQISAQNPLSEGDASV
jgi:hypothetical protein